MGPISNKVGPVGAFSLAYELGPAIPSDVERLIDRRGSRRYELRGWELVPESDHRGETYESASNPISDFSRRSTGSTRTGRRSPCGSTPTASSCTASIRADLVARGFSVAARPLPAGLGIRGSPMGSQSAAQ